MSHNYFIHVLLFSLYLNHEILSLHTMLYVLSIQTRIICSIQTRIIYSIQTVP